MLPGGYQILLSKSYFSRGVELFSEFRWQPGRSDEVDF